MKVKRQVPNWDGRLTGHQDTEAQMQELMHDGNENGFADQATRGQADRKGVQERMEAYGAES